MLGVSSLHACIAGGICPIFVNIHNKLKGPGGYVVGRGRVQRGKNLSEFPYDQRLNLRTLLIFSTIAA
ncbi:hypothetical protein CCP2SC5_70074 [Azospirillaceae bacterium]